MISKTGEAETITTHYLFFLGLYRALYLINWIWRFYFEGFFDMIAIVAGVVQTILYCDFFYLYVTKGESSCSLRTYFLSKFGAVFLQQSFNFCAAPRQNCHHTKKKHGNIFWSRHNLKGLERSPFTFPLQTKQVINRKKQTTS
jgi:hypothetical protein